MSAINMTVAEALTKADEYESLDAISPPAKAARALAKRVRELEKYAAVYPFSGDRVTATEVLAFAKAGTFPG